MDNMYRENILDHGMNPRNSGILDPATIDFEVNNPLCGDRLRLTLRINADNVVTDVGWDGEGCAISQAAASMLGEEILGKSLDVIRQISKEDIFTWLGIPISANRVRCALLGLKALNIGLYGNEHWREIQDNEEED
jgi:nitrogen fixation protein NifU and related proteins